MLPTRSLLPITVILGLALATGCDDRRRADDDDDDGGGGLAGLDRDDDGALTDGDVDSGEGAIYWVRVVDGDEDGASEEGHTDPTASLLTSDGAFGVEISTGGDLALSVTLWFENPDPQSADLGTGPGDLAWVNARSDAEDVLAWASSSSGIITITEVANGAASGFFAGEVELTIANRLEQPTGEVVRIEGFAFSDLALPVDQ